jgi:PAS domain S-box-containing protein
MMGKRAPGRPGGNRAQGARRQIPVPSFLVEAIRVRRGTLLQSDGKRRQRSHPNHDRLLFAAVADSCCDALICTDASGIVTTWNESAARLFGYSAAEMVGAAFHRIVPEECHAQENEVLQNLSPSITLRYECMRLHKTTGPLRVLTSVSAMQDEAGTLLGVLRMEREIPVKTRDDEVHARLAAIVESSDDAIVSKNLDGIVTSWNNAACRLFGHTAEEMIGKSILTIIPPDLHSEETEIIGKIRAGARIDHYETRRVRKDGEIVEVSLTISPIKDRTGKVIGSSKIAREISQRKKIERRLIQSEKLAATGRMAATIAHEINNPLDSVMNLVYLARTMLANNSKAVPYLLTAEKELERVSHIARQTLGYYRDPGPPSEIHLDKLFEEVLSVYRFKLLAGNIAVDCAFAHYRAISASRDELMQVFSNLITNAIDAMPEGGVMTIKTREVDGKGVEIQVRDRGTGISAENLDRVFEPFFSTKEQHGTGIGLWVARQLLEKRGGSINLQSETKFPDNGTTVSVFIPFQA